MGISGWGDVPGSWQGPRHWPVHTHGFLLRLLLLCWTCFGVPTLRATHPSCVGSVGVCVVAPTHLSISGVHAGLRLPVIGGPPCFLTG